tara:strand:- start:192 stop:776 length:585 start_codon:yes stop_codon:yes gene_type:complete
MANISDNRPYFSSGGSEPILLPEITLPDGSSRTDPESYTSAELESIGFTGPYRKPKYQSDTHYLEWVSSDLRYNVTPLPEKSIDQKWADVRAKRDRLLKESDWSMGVDVPGTVNKHEWRLYRQRLRDITTTAVDPDLINWPIDPFTWVGAGRSFQDPVREEPKIQWEIEDLKTEINTLYSKINTLNVKVGIATT